MGLIYKDVTFPLISKLWFLPPLLIFLSLRTFWLSQNPKFTELNIAWRIISHWVTFRKPESKSVWGHAFASQDLSLQWDTRERDLISSLLPESQMGQGIGFVPSVVTGSLTIILRVGCLFLWEYNWQIREVWPLSFPTLHFGPPRNHVLLPGGPKLRPCLSQATPDDPKQMLPPFPVLVQISKFVGKLIPTNLLIARGVFILFLLEIFKCFTRTGLSSFKEINLQRLWPNSFTLWSNLLLFLHLTNSYSIKLLVCKGPFLGAAGTAPRWNRCWSCF